jgi:hypothetical protein
MMVMSPHMAGRQGATAIGDGVGHGACLRGGAGGVQAQARADARGRWPIC